MKIRNLIGMVGALLVLLACEGEAELQAQNDTAITPSTQLCAESPHGCYYEAWWKLAQLDSAQTLLDSLWWVRQSQALVLTAAIHSDDPESLKLFHLANELKWPLLKSVDSALSLQENLVELSPELLRMEKQIIHNWYGKEMSWILQLQKVQTEEPSALRLQDLKSRLADLKDIQAGKLPKREMSWIHRAVEWGRQ